MKTAIKVGTVVYLEELDSRSRKDQDIREAIVTKVGNKYFEVDTYCGKFNKETMYHVSNYGSPKCLVHLSLQEVADEREKNRITMELRGKFGGYGNVKLSLDQLRDVLKIVSSEN